MPVRHVRYLRWAFCPIAAGLALTATQAQTTETGGRATANCAAAIQRPLDFAVLLEMDFGSIVASNKPGTIRLDPASGSRDCSVGDMVCIGSYSWSRLALSGSAAAVRITYSPSFTLTGPGQDIQAELNFPNGSGSTVLLDGGTTLIDIGALLHVNPNQKPGRYKGSFAINVNYE